TSRCVKTTAWPLAVSASASVLPSASRMSPITTEAPSWAKSRASAAPIPRAPPLISATFPASLIGRPRSAARAGDGLRDQPGALVALLRGLVAEREADVVLAPALVREEGAARRELHARLHRELGELLLVGAARQLDPEKEAALGTAHGVIRAREHFVEPAQHRVALGAID